MSRKWVVDASPIILLAKIGRPELLSICSEEVLIPAVVADGAARRCAQGLNISVVGTLGVLVVANRIGQLETVRPVIEDLERAGLHVSEELIDYVLQVVEER